MDSHRKRYRDYEDDRSYRRRDDYEYERHKKPSRRDEYDYDDEGYGRGNRRYVDDYTAKKSKPNNTVMIRGLQADCTEHMVMTAINAKNKYNVHNLRVVRDRISGVCKGFAFLEFYTVGEATDFMREFSGSLLYPLESVDREKRREYVEKELFICDRPVTLEFASNMDTSNYGGDRHRQQPNDWVCSVCQKMNFARRSECFGCGHSFGPDCQLVSEFGDPKRDIYQGCKVLHVSYLPANCTEDMVYKTFSEFGNIQTVRMLPTGGRAYVEYLTVEQAAQAYRICLSQQNILRVGEAIVHVEMADLTGNYPVQAVYSDAVATAALQAASWSSQHLQQRMMLEASTTYSTTQFQPQAPKALEEWPTPFEQGGMTYIVEPSSGLYYEEKSGYYYDYNRKVYYSTVKQKYFKLEDGKFNECENVELAQKEQIANDESEKQKSKGAVLSFAIEAGNLEKELGEIEESSSGVAESENQSGTTGAEEKSQSAVKFVPLPKEAKKIDRNLKQWNSQKGIKPICTLCRRKFESQEKLERHVKLSELHKKNLEEQKLQPSKKMSKPISTAEPRSVEAATKAAVAAGYRDRAGDRRKLFGQDKKPGTTTEEALDRMETPIYVAEEENKGAQFLKAMGWKEGQGLGKDGKGIVAPIRADGSVQEAPESSN